MEKVKTIAWLVVAALFLLWTLAAFPSLGCLLFLIGAAVSAPIPAVRDFWDEKGLRGAPKVALAVALLIAGSVAAQDRFAERGEEQEPPSETAEIAEAAPSADAESVPDEGETAPETPTESAPPETEIPENAILLVAGEKGEYGKWTAMNDETFYAYYLPGGVYSVTNAGEYPAQVSVYEGILRNFETGFDEYSATGGALRLEVGESGEIAIPDGWFVEIHEPTKAAFVRIGDAPEPEPEPAEETGASVEDCIALIKTALENSFENCNVYLNESGRVLTVDVWRDGLTRTAFLAYGGNQELLDSWNTNVVTTSLAITKSAQNVLDRNGHQDVTVLFNVLDDTNLEKPLLIIMFGAVVVDAANGINQLN